MVEAYPDFFNDVFGPVMQPGSSSHTAGPCRLGFLAHSLLGEAPAKVRVILDDEGSFAGTFGIMSEDSAMLAGVMGMLPDDVRLFNARSLAEERGIDDAFEFGTIRESRHPNAVKFVLTGASGRAATLVGESTGGGMVRTVAVNGYPLEVTGDTYVLLVSDPEMAFSPQDLGRLSRGLDGLAGLITVETDNRGRLSARPASSPIWHWRGTRRCSRCTRPST